MSLYDVIIENLNPFTIEDGAFYGIFQMIAFLAAYLLRKGGIVAFGLPLVHYIFALIIGHLTYVIALSWFLMHIEIIP